MCIRDRPYNKSQVKEYSTKSGLGLGIFIGKTLLEKNLANGNSPADILINKFNNQWGKNINEIYRKSFSLNKIINKENGQDIISSYKRAANIIENELKDKNLELSETADPGIFKNDFEKNLFKKIKELKKYFSNIDKDENYETTLDNLKTAKPIIFAFFDNIVVNDDDEIIKKNRLELLQMFCRTFENYINFSKIESI